MASTTFLQKAYLAYFGRPADASGLITFANVSEAQVIASFSASPESQEFFGSMPLLDQINTIYKNLFNRDAEPAGLAHWAGKITKGELTLAGAAMEIMNNAQNSDVTAVANKLAASAAFTAAVDTTAEILGYAGAAAIAPARAFLAAVSSDAATLTAATATAALSDSVATVVAAGVAGQNPVQTFMLTTGADNIVGTAGNDNVTAVIGDDATLTPLDVINGGEGTDTISLLNMKGDTILPLGVTVTSVENVSVRSVAGVKVDISTWSDVQSVAVTQATTADLKAGATTAVSITGATGDIKVTGGSTVNVASAAAGKKVEIGDSKGAVTVTATKDAGAIKVTGGTDVTVTSTAATKSETIDATKATGAIVVTQNLNSDGKAVLEGGAITTEGGTTVTINVNATSTAKDDKASNGITVGAITATAGDKTTAITINQNDTVTAFTTAAKAAVVATETVKFDAVAAGKVVEVGGLKFTATKALTAAEVAAAFADLTVEDTQSAGGLVTNGTYTVKLAAGWTSAAASGDTVVFTGAADNTPTLAAKGDGIKEAKYVAGTAAAAKADTINAVTFGAVTVAGGKALTSLTLNGYIKATVTAADALTTLSLTDSAGAATVASAETATLAMTVNNVKHDVTFTAPKLATLNLTTAGKDSAFNLKTTTALKTLAVTGDKAVDLSGGSDLTALETVTVSGAAGLTLGSSPIASLKSINTTATTGTVAAMIDGSKTTFTGGAGVDKVTLDTGLALTKAIDLGAGDDTLSFGALLVTGSTATLAGGEGTDTVSMSAAAAAGLDDAAVTFLTGFERLHINDAGKAEVIDLANLGFTNRVSTTGGELTLKNLANEGTVVVTAATTGLTVLVKDAAAGKADTLNVVLSSKDALAGNTLTAGNVETLNVISDDTDKTAHTNALTVTADKATTIKVSGNAALDLTMTDSKAVTLVDGSAATGALKVASNADSATATTIKGGSGADMLTANHNQDVLEGGAGKDTLSVANGANLVTLRGGAGQDTYVIGKASNSNGYATIDGAAADLLGDVIQFGSAVTSFSSAKIVLGSTAVFQDYANEAAKAGAAGSVSWFQWAGDTYLVQDNTTGTASFSNTNDAIVKLVGTSVNFSFNSTAPGSLEII